VRAKLLPAITAEARSNCNLEGDQAKLHGQLRDFAPTKTL
jgi:hypothetical protein